MKEKSIIFNSEMIRAILDGRKSQTRRVIKPQPSSKLRPCLQGSYPGIWSHTGEVDNIGELHKTEWKSPYGKVGDRLWVRETFGDSGLNRVEYRAFPADGKDFRSVSRWKPSIHMPRKHSRITLEITGIRVERVEHISFEDCLSEGCDKYFEIEAPDCKHPDCKGKHYSQKYHFKELWESCYGKGAWERNDFIWVIEFKVV